MTYHRAGHEIRLLQTDAGMQLTCECGWTVTYRARNPRIETLWVAANNHRTEVYHPKWVNPDPYMDPLETPDYER